LAVELALDRLSLDAVRAKRGVQVGEEGLKAAVLLRDYFSRMLQTLKTGSVTINSGANLSAAAREALQSTLEALPRSKNQFDKVDPKAIKALVELLTKLVDCRKLDRTNATALVQTLKVIDAANQEKRPASPLDDLVSYAGV
jgi:hypothetical protein